MTANRKTFVAFAVLTAVFAGLLYRAEHHTDIVNQRVNKVESPCLRYGPKSDACQESFERAVATITHVEACAVERKAGTLKAIRALASALRAEGVDVSFTEPCAGARLAQELQRHNQRAGANGQVAQGHNSGGGGGAAPVPSGSQASPAPQHHGTIGGVKAPNGGSKETPAPPNPGSEAPSVPSSPGANGGQSPATPASTPASAGESGPPASTTSEAKPLLPLQPTVETAVKGVCSAADHLLNLC